MRKLFRIIPFNNLYNFLFSKNIERKFYNEKLLLLVIFSFIFSLNNSFSQNGSKRWGEPTNLTILNSNSDDFAPFFLKENNLLIFNSDKDGKTYFYSSNLLDNGGFSEPKLMKSAMNVMSNHQSYFTSPDGKEAYFSTYRKSSKQSYLNIFRTIYNKNRWSDPFPVDSLICDAFCSHVTVSPNGNLMVFASTRNSENINLDLWMSFRSESGNWTTPIPIDELNSDGNEITPYLHNNDTLYFASDGYEGPGAYDLYFSTRIGNRWERPRPVNDINTEFNESDFTILPDGRAIFSSDRPGGAGKLDLYIASPVNNQKVAVNSRIGEIIIRTQVSNIIAERKSILSKFPPFHFFAGQSFECSTNMNSNILDSLLFNYPKIISEFLLANSNEILVLDSSLNNRNVAAYFQSQGIASERLVFQKGSTNKETIKFKLLSGNPLPLIEISEDSYTYKPPVIEISVDSKDLPDVGKHSLSLTTNFAEHNLPVSGSKLPLRDLISIDEYDGEVYNSDSVIINYRIKNDEQVIASASRDLFVSRQQIREQKVFSLGTENYEEYYLIIPDKIFFDSDYISKDYLQIIRESIANCRKIKLEYFDEAMKLQAGKVKELIWDSFKNIKKPEIITEQTSYQANEYFSKDLSSLIIRIRMFNR